jgi:hypothetical protein
MKSGASLLPWFLAALGPGIAIVPLLGHLAADIIMVRVPDHKASDTGRDRRDRCNSHPFDDAAF